MKPGASGDRRDAHRRVQGNVTEAAGPNISRQVGNWRYGCSVAGGYNVFFLYVHFGLGFDITALLATSAALSLVVGLALQATLGNLFAGISIELERMVRVGDYVRRRTLAGRVVSLGWRSIPCAATPVRS